MGVFRKMLKYFNLFYKDCLPRIIFVAVLLSYIRLGTLFTDMFYQPVDLTFWEYFEKNGYIFSSFLFFLKIPVYIYIPYIGVAIFGLVAYNPFQRRTVINKISDDTPFVCFRVVTRGTYPKLVAKVTQQNLETCRKMGMKNFKFEIVTDLGLNMPPSHEVREIVVPRNYRTPNNTLFKARALHYCLDDHVNILSTNDWIVHLDEETLLTESVLLGIAEFVSDPKSNIGQGVITYGGCGVENWITTFMDGMRVTTDYGMYRFAFQYMHRPFFGLKGSFVVVKMCIEKDVGFDFGPKECIAEDLRFALSAWDKGYRFDFVEGIMKEKSTFTFEDFIKQRKRWFVGHFNIMWSKSLPLYTKLIMFPLHINTFLSWTYVVNLAILMFIRDIPSTKGLFDVRVFATFYSLFAITFGNFMSFNSGRMSLFKRVFIGLISQITLPFLGIIESYARIKGLIQKNHVTFDIVEKEEETLRGPTKHTEFTGTIIEA